MTDQLLALLPDYGAPLLGLITLLSCLALPVPASLFMMAAGGFAAAGDLPLGFTILAALTGAVIGDQIGYALGRSGAGWLQRIESRGGKQAMALSRATSLTRERGNIAVFLSRWLLSPLGPYVNFVAGAARLRWPTFTIASATGEIAWVTIYVGIGAGAADQFGYLWPVISDMLGLLAALTVALLLALRLRHMLQLHRKLGHKKRR
ncbi:SNARE associated Golgi protein [Thalassovita gelatinovora]|uniref:SNARE associated Golgi protein n=1 Tax=Thalassovita gelatinovora TaxID=53501 RepID=A0A0P1FJY6_THAGE|nr:VTT domain-containing protein [Thalassovita gelatinovora]QIZ79339.1 VTT domain-containing protein [Thalassovita gelatinovora]CUH62603.1 SNARE associated Golgi protein [Thalassovita gelatinovora]SEQ07149.1 membrane protein DedA, SNARE-associated domain [Thalassovita gelatinovora]